LIQTCKSDVQSLLDRPEKVLPLPTPGGLDDPVCAGLGVVLLRSGGHRGGAGNDVIDDGAAVVSIDKTIKTVALCAEFMWNTGQFNRTMQAANSTNWRVAA